MKIVATTQLVVQTMVVFVCLCGYVGMWVYIYCLYKKYIKKFIIFAQGYRYERGRGRVCVCVCVCVWVAGIMAMCRVNQNHLLCVMMNAVSCSYVQCLRLFERRVARRCDILDEG